MVNAHPATIAATGTTGKGSGGDGIRFGEVVLAGKRLHVPIVEALRLLLRIGKIETGAGFYVI